MKLLKLGTVALDGTKMHANASRHSALSYGHAEKLEAQLQMEVAELLPRRGGRRSPCRRVEPPEELARREARFKPSARRRPRSRRAPPSASGEQADYEAKVKAREEQSERTGRAPALPTPPTPGPAPTRSISPIPMRIMPRGWASAVTTPKRRWIPPRC